MVSIPDDSKKIARLTIDAFGKQFQSKFQRFWDEKENSYVDILRSIDNPQKNLTSYSTIGLSNFPLYKGNVEYKTRIEIIGVCESKVNYFDNAIATAAFFIINSKLFCYPGAIFNDILSMYNISSQMSHLLFVTPFLWDGFFKTITIGNKTVSWLLAIPISTKEKDYAEKNGVNALEDLFESEQIDIFDLERVSVVV